MRCGSVALAVALAVPGAARALCTMATTGMSFGAYDTLSSAPLDAVADVVVTCPAGVAYTVSLDAGRQPEDLPMGRGMRSAGDGTLRYDLFRDGSFQEAWRDAAGNTVFSAVGTGEEQRFRVFGRLAPSQRAAAGGYEDFISVTLAW